MGKGNYTYQLQKDDQLQNNKFGCYTSFLFRYELVWVFVYILLVKFI